MQVNGKRRFPVAVLVAVMAAVLLSGCVTKRLTSERYCPEGNNEGIAYALPKAYLEVKADYNVYQKTVAAKGSGEKISLEVFALIESPVTVTGKIVADLRQIYVASPQAIANSALLESDMTIDLSETGFMKSISAVVKDKSPEIAKSVTKSAISLAKLATTAGDRVLLGDDVRIDEIGKFSTKYVLDPEEMKEKSAEEGKPRVLCAELHPGAIALDPSDPTSMGAGAVKNIPKLEVEIAIPAACGKECTALGTQESSSMSGSAKCSKKRGIVYRTPAPVIVSVIANPGKLNEVQYPATVVNLPQFGAVAVLPVSSKAWTERTTSATFSDSTGALTQYKVKSESSALSMAKTAEEITQSLVDAQMELMQHQIDLLKKQDELNKAKAAAAGPDVIEQLTAQIVKYAEELTQLKKAVDDLKKLVDILKPVPAPVK